MFKENLKDHIKFNVSVVSRISIVYYINNTIIVISATQLTFILVACYASANIKY